MATTYRKDDSVTAIRGEHQGQRGYVSAVTAAGVEVEWDDGDITVEQPGDLEDPEPTERELARYYNGPEA